MKYIQILSPGQTIRQYTGDESLTINHAPVRPGGRGATEVL